LPSRQRNGSGLLDRFRGRIMFPLADPKGHVLGFGARALSPDDQPKYLNTSESELFHKGSLVYGADLARAAAARAGRLVLVEGYTDVIALRQAGIPETVCSMGTALTDRQLDALKRLTPKVLLCQDPDAAGQEAVAKGKDAIRVFNEGHHLRGFDLRVVRLPPGQDPADVVQREGAEAMRALLETSVPVPRFEVERALESARLDTPDGREDALRAVGPVVAKLDPGPLQYDLIQLIANRLQMPESMTQEALRRVPRSNGGGRAAPPIRPSTSVDRREDTERAFLARCLAIKDAGRRALEEMDIELSFSLDLTRRAAHYLVEHLEHPGQSLPAGADDLARLVAELVIRAGDLAADPMALALERLQLDKHRVTRQIAAGESVITLSAERQRIQSEIDRLTPLVQRVGA
jgi:DNA primase